MKKWFSILLIGVLLLPGLAAAQDDEKDDIDLPKKQKTKFGGAGGFMMSMGLFSFDEINKTLVSSRMPKFKSNSLYLAGGVGYGYIMFMKNVRFGGMGTGGSVISSFFDPATNTKKEVEYNISYGGFLVDYVYPVADQLDIAAGITIGGGGIDIKLNRDNGNFKEWGGLWKEFGNNDSTKNLTRNLNGAFFVVQPSIFVEYALLQWFQIRIGVSYPLMLSPEWRLENNYEMVNVPSALKADGFVVNGGLMFGFFN